MIHLWKYVQFLSKAKKKYMSVYGYILQKNRVGRSDFHFISHTEILDCGPIHIRKRYQTFRIYLIALRSEGVIIPQKNCCGRIIKKLMPIIFQDVTGNSFFRPKISDVYIFTFDLPIKWTRWTRVAAENRVGRVTVNRHIFCFGLIEQTT